MKCNRCHQKTNWFCMVCEKYWCRDCVLKSSIGYVCPICGAKLYAIPGGDPDG